MEKVDIFGKSMLMRGAGTINLSDGKIAMAFYPFGKWTESKPDFIEKFWRSLGPALAEVKVDGTFDKPIIKATVPILSKPLGIFGTEKRKE